MFRTDTHADKVERAGRVTAAPDGPGVAVLGCGQWGANHLRVWDGLGCLRVACDPDPARLALVREHYPGVETDDSVQSVLGRNDVDAVVVATPARTHAALATEALDGGKHVLVEKPLATAVAGAQSILDAASRSDTVLMVGHVLEYHPAFLELRKLVDDGSLGGIQYVYSHRLNLGRVRIEENALWSFAPHDVALVLRLLGGLPDVVACEGGSYISEGVADVTMMTMRFGSGVRAHVFVSWLHPFKEQRFVVVGERQMAVFDDSAPWAEKLVLFPHRVEVGDAVVPVARRAEAVFVELRREEPLVAECRHFMERVVDGRAPLTDGQSGLDVLRVLERGQASLEDDATPRRVWP